MSFDIFMTPAPSLKRSVVSSFMASFFNQTRGCRIHKFFSEAETANRPFLGALAGCSARRSERRVASHTSEEQRRNAPGSAAKNGILAFSASLTDQSVKNLFNGKTIANNSHLY